ncbi:hypothetical protein TWF103_011561 [Orbilia oligospora]|uniref:Uncharacterized protein n=2 Tax=Orbilia oligospora TaxID=2813651 RepID=A0A7C8K255_ORBOL|nr:hypothetical protein TWF103_011561 [Orbilia oligospora]KAF3147225.1 hypothetical protein TWF703_000065 [Orbilia oligospora]
MAMIESLASAYYIPSRSMAFRIRSDSDKIIPNRVEHIKSIIFRILSKIPEGYLETLELAVPWSLDDGFGSVISSHRNLTSLNICAQDFRRKTHPEHAETADLIEWKFPCLENLHLDFPRTNYGVSITSSILRSAPQLSRIHIQFRSFQEASVNFSDLLQSLANQNPRDLYLGGIDLNSLRAKYWNRWTNFAISDCQNISSIVPLTSRRYLKRLTIQGWRTQTLEVAGILNNLQPGLEGLSLVLNNDTDEEIADSAINDEILLKHQHSLKSLHIDVPKYRDCFSQVLLLRQFKEISEFGLAIDSDQITLEFIDGWYPFIADLAKIKSLYIIQSSIHAQKKPSWAQMSQGKHRLLQNVVQWLCHTLFYRTPFKPEVECISVAEGLSYTRFRAFWVKYLTLNAMPDSQGSILGDAVYLVDLSREGVRPIGNRSLM